MKYFGILFLAAKSILICCPFDNKNCTECSNFKYGIKKIGWLPSEVMESSGLAVIGDLIITHPDGGNPPVLWELNYSFKKETLVNGLIDLRKHVDNFDWEDLASDDRDHLYIGDFGNNNQQRKNLNIIRYNLSSKEIGLIEFYYPDQELFPPQRNKEWNYDCEAMFWFEGNLYLFSKNKGNKNVKIYRVPDRPGNYAAETIDTLQLPLQITAADISPDHQLVALLAYGKVLIYSVNADGSGDLQLTPYKCKQFSRSGQAEAIAFLDERHLMITNEKGKVFLMYLKKDHRKKERYRPELEQVFPSPDLSRLKDID